MFDFVLLTVVGIKQFLALPDECNLIAQFFNSNIRMNSVIDTTLQIRNTFFFCQPFGNKHYITLIEFLSKLGNVAYIFIDVSLFIKDKVVFTCLCFRSTNIYSFLIIRSMNHPETFHLAELGQILLIFTYIKNSSHWFS